MTTDEWGIDDGWFDVDGQWHTTPPETIEAIRAAMGDPADRPVWVVRPGATDSLHSPCHLVLEDGEEAGTISSWKAVPLVNRFS